MTTTTAARPDAGLVEQVAGWIDANWDPELTVREWWRRLFDAGYTYPTWPLGAGGAGLSARQARTITGVLAEHRVLGPPVGHVAATLAAPTILEHGTDQQIHDLVGPIARGEMSWCQLFSEPGSGSDLASLGATAVPDGDRWIVNGQKVWNSAANAADLGMLLARTDPDVPKHRGITYFAIDMHQPGIEVRPLRVMNGTTAFCEVFLTDAVVEPDRVIGAVNDGWKVAQTTLLHERGSVAGGGVPGLLSAQSGSRHGDLDRRLGEIVARKARRADSPRNKIRSGAVGVAVMLELAADHGVATDALVRQELARYYSCVKVNGWTMRRSAAAGGRLTGADGSIAKITTSRICQDSRDLTYRIAGASLMLAGDESPMGGELQSVNLASPGTRIGGGTDEIQLNVLAERALGLPREPSEDRDLPYRQLRVGTQR